MSTDCERENDDRDAAAGDAFSLKVKPEFILQERASSLPPLPPSDTHNSMDPGDEPQNQEDTGDDREDNKKIRKKNRRGQNKKRPRDIRQDDSEKVCLAIFRGEICPFGDNCRFSHDIKAYMATRPSDIVEVEGGCPTYNNHGFCMYGAMCRVGSNHITKSGNNLRKDVKDDVPNADLVKAEEAVTENVEGEQSNNDADKDITNSGDNSRKDAKNDVPHEDLVKSEEAVKENGKEKQSTTDADKDITKSGDNLRKDAKDDAPHEDLVKTDEGVKENGEDEQSSKDADKATSLQYEHDVINILPKDLQFQLRKNTYLFVCKRHFEKGKNGKQSDKVEHEVKSNNASPFTPLEKLKTRKIVDFSNKVYVAPLTTVGNLPFRRIMKDCDADITCGEMAVVTNLLDGKASEWALLKRHKCEDVFGIQLAASHPDQYTRVSELIEKYTDVDFVDLNLGCPLDLLCNKGAGAALMMRENKLKGALLGMSSNLSCSITVKMRTGWDMNKPFAHQLVPKIQSWGIDGLAAIMVHGRSRLQRYKAEADWDYISKVEASESEEKPKIPLIGNGDIFSYQEYEEKVLAHPNLSKTAMLGRGALIKPWLPREIKEKRSWDISSSERLDILKSFIIYGLEHWGSDQQGVNNTRRFLLEWLSFLHRYVPVGLLEVLPQKMNQRPPTHMMGRNDLETLFMSPLSSDWIKISEMLLGPVPDGFKFEPKHKGNSYVQNG